MEDETLRENGVSMACELEYKVKGLTCSDDTPARRKSEIQHSFEQCVIFELQCLIMEEVVTHCHGCQIDHPSQKQHDICLFMDSNDHTELFLYDAMDKMNPYNIMEKWYPQVRLMELEDGEILEVYRLWKSIKDKNIITIDKECMDQWSDKVKTAWQTE